MFKHMRAPSTTGTFWDTKPTLANYVSALCGTGADAPWAQAACFADASAEEANPATPRHSDRPSLRPAACIVLLAPHGYSRRIDDRSCCFIRVTEFCVV